MSETAPLIAHIIHRLDYGGLENGLVNLINPTFAVVVGGLAIAHVSYIRWLAFIWPLMLILLVFITAALTVAALL